jgi:hypothetical protein
MPAEERPDATSNDEPMEETLEEKRARRGRALTRKIHLHDDHEAFNREIWSAVDPSVRAAYVFELSVLAARLQGFSGDQLRLDKSVARVQRGRG